MTLLPRTGSGSEEMVLLLVCLGVPREFATPWS